jgi:hypothetical protein
VFPLELLLAIASHIIDDHGELRYGDFNAFHQVNRALYANLNGVLWKEAAKHRFLHVARHARKTKNWARHDFLCEQRGLPTLAQRRPVLRLSVGGEACTTDELAVTKLLRTWTENVSYENLDESDLQSLCEFLRAVVRYEGRLDKAAGFVRIFLALAGDKHGWGRVCEGVVDTVRTEAWKKGIPNLRFDRGFD